MKKKKLRFLLKVFGVFLVLGVAYYNQYFYTPENPGVRYTSYSPSVRSGSDNTDFGGNSFQSSDQQSSSTPSAGISYGSGTYSVPSGSSGGSSGGFSTIISASSSASGDYSQDNNSQGSYLAEGSASSESGPSAGVAIPQIFQTSKSKEKARKKGQDENAIAGRSTGFGSGFNNPDLDTPMAPPPPPDEEVPLDGGTFVIIIGGILIGCYRLFKTSHAFVAQKTN